MGFARLGHVLLGALSPLAILACVCSDAESAAPLGAAFALIVLALTLRLSPISQPLSSSLAYPALAFGALPLLQAILLPDFIWRRITSLDPALQAEVARLGVVLPTTWSIEPETSIRSAVIAIGAAAVFLLARHAAARRVGLWSLIVLLSSITAWQALEGLSQYFAGLWLLDGGEVAHGHFVNRGYYAAFLNTGFWLSAAAARSQVARAGASPARALLLIGSIFTSLVSLTAMVASQSRSALLVLAILLLAVIALLPLDSAKRAALALSAGVCCGVFFSSPVAEPLLGRFRQLYEEGGDPGRLLIWRDSVAALTSLGSGAGSFPSVFERTTPYFLRKSVDSGHSDYVEWAVEFGPLFAVLFAISLAVALVYLLTRAKNNQNPEHCALGLGAVFAAAALALHALTDSVLHSATLLFVLASLLGLASGLGTTIPKKRQRLGTGLLAAGLCAATLLLGGAFARFNVTSLFSEARQSQLQGDSAAASEGYAAVLRANPRIAPAWLALSEIERLQGHTVKALHHARTARTVEPFTYRVEWALADLLLTTGDVQGGVEGLRTICLQLPDLRPAAYLLAYRAGAPLDLIEGRLTAPEPYAIGEYLAFLIRSGNGQELAAAQQRLVEGHNIQLSEAHKRYLARFAAGTLP